MKKVLQPVVECDLNSIDTSKYACEKELHRKFSSFYKVKKNQLTLFNGCESAIHAFFLDVVLHQKIHTCYIYAPIFSFFIKLAKRCCPKVVIINRFEELDYEIEEDALVIFSNPSKPDGQYHELQMLYSLWQSKNATILLDEVFLDFCTHESLSDEIKQYDKLYILKSLQRFFNTQGLQCAALLSTALNIEWLNKHKSKYQLSSLDTAYIKQMLLDSNFKKIYQAINVKNMTLLQEVLKCTGLVEKIYPSHTNMLLCQLKNLTAKEFIQKFGHTQVDIKTCENFHFLDEFHVRFTIYSEEDVHSLVSQFQKSFKGNQ